MGLRFFRTTSKEPRLQSLPSGSFTVDSGGHVLASTLPQSFPVAYVNAIARNVLQSFRKAEKAQLVFTEVVIHYSALKITARELRGGAIIFLAPQGVSTKI